MKIAFDGRSLASLVHRGWDRYAVALIRELVRRGVEVTLLHRARQPLVAATVAELGCRTLSIRDLNGLHYEQVAVPYALLRGRYDLFHAPFEYGVPLAAPCPVIFTIHSVTRPSYEDLIARGLLPGQLADYLGPEPRPHPFLPSWLMARYVPAQVARADRILAPSEFCREEIIRFLKVPPERVTVTPLAIPEQFRCPPSAPGERAAVLEWLGVRPPFLLYVGGYEPHKNVPGLLEAFARIRARRPELQLVAVGSKGLPDSIRSRAEALGLRPGRDVVLLVNLTAELTDLYDAVVGRDVTVPLALSKKPTGAIQTKPWGPCATSRSGVDTPSRSGHPGMF